MQAAGKLRAVYEGVELVSITGSREFGGLGASLAVVNLTVGGEDQEYEKCLNVLNVSRWAVSLRRFWWWVNLGQTVTTVGGSKLEG